VEENKNPLAVRWDTEHEEADVNRLIKAGRAGVEPKSKAPPTASSIDFR
jgi:hypothetical protein